MLLGFWGLEFGQFYMAKVDTAILFVSSEATSVSLNNSYYSEGGKIIMPYQYSSQACPSHTAEEMTLGYICTVIHHIYSLGLVYRK